MVSGTILKSNGNVINYDTQDNYDTQEGMLSISYYTYYFERSPPPAALVAGNFESVDPHDVDLNKLAKEPYFINGWRGLEQLGNDEIPEKGKITKMMRLRGDLAHYYDPNADQIWWIETRPADKILYRPDFKD